MVLRLINLNFFFAGGPSVGQIMSILVKDKFLFTATTIPAEVDGALSHSQLTEVMKVRQNFLSFVKILVQITVIG